MSATGSCAGRRRSETDAARLADRPGAFGSAIHPFPPVRRSSERQLDEGGHMAASITRRTFVTTGAAAAGALLPGVAAYAKVHPTNSVRFTLNAEVLDGGEQVT